MPRYKRKNANQIQQHINAALNIETNTPTTQKKQYTSRKARRKAERESKKKRKAKFNRNHQNAIQSKPKTKKRKHTEISTPKAHAKKVKDIYGIDYVQKGSMSEEPLRKKPRLEPPPMLDEPDEDDLIIAQLEKRLGIKNGAVGSGLDCLLVSLC